MATHIPQYLKHMWVHCRLLAWHTVAQLVDVLRYKSEGRVFDSRWSHSNFMAPGFDSASNINQYQEYFLGVKGGRCVELTNLPPSCTYCLEIWEPQPPGILRAAQELLYLIISKCLPSGPMIECV